MGFGLPPEKIQIVVQRQSIVHSAVQFSDNSIIAQLGVPDMRIPIQYALTHPKRVPGVVPELDFTTLKLLTFDVADEETFRCLAACKRPSARAVLAPAPLTVPTRKPLSCSLRIRLAFWISGRLVEAVVDSDSFGGDYTLADVYECDRMGARIRAGTSVTLYQNIRSGAAFLKRRGAIVNECHLLSPSLLRCSCSVR